MRSLSIENFSCIDSANLTLSKLTVLIGPQASGKSVISKLVYFFNSLVQDQFSPSEESAGLLTFKAHVRTKFEEWFPPSAWGARKFCIEYTAGDVRIRLSRRLRSGKPSPRVQVTLSPYFEKQYQEYLAALSAGKKADVDVDGSEFEVDYLYKTRDLARRKLAEHQGDDYVARQLFVPAGRAFFTTVGKAMAVFEQGRILDPITLVFGRYFSALRDRGLGATTGPGTRRRPFGATALKRLFGGEIRRIRDTDFIETDDGRRIPLSALSSGQQELLPLWFALDQWTSVRLIRPNSGSRLLYLEEPEAHLFPSAQSLIVELLATVAMAERGGSDLLMTTHSPYVLAKLNNLLKAGELSRLIPDSRHAEISAIVPKDAWLMREAVGAFALKGGTLKGISDSDGLIDGDYLDSVSGDISRELNKLLVLERAYAN